MNIRDILIGSWYRTETTDDGLSYSEIATMHADGQFEFAFSTSNTHGVVIEEIVEKGYWGLVADIHFTLTREELINGKSYTADLTNAENYHAYKVINLNEELFEYQHAESGELYQLRRISETAS